MPRQMVWTPVLWTTRWVLRAAQWAARTLTSKNWGWEDSSFQRWEHMGHMGKATYYIVYHDTLCCSLFLEMLDVWISERLPELSRGLPFFFQWFFPEKMGLGISAGMGTGWGLPATSWWEKTPWTQKKYRAIWSHGATRCWICCYLLSGVYNRCVFEENDELCVRNSNDHGPWHPKLGSWLWWPTSFGLVSNFSETWLHLNMRHTFKIVISWEAMRHGNPWKPMDQARWVGYYRFTRCGCPWRILHWKTQKGLSLNWAPSPWIIVVLTWSMISMFQFWGIPHFRTSQCCLNFSQCRQVTHELHEPDPPPASVMDGTQYCWLNAQLSLVNSQKSLNVTKIPMTYP